MDEIRSDPQDCPCQEGMFPRKSLSRRGLLFAAGSSAGVAVAGLSGQALAAGAAPAGAVLYDVPPDPTKELGRPLGVDGGYGTRSQFETAIRAPAPNPNPNTSWSYTPLASLIGNLTPSGCITSAITPACRPSIQRNIRWSSMASFRRRNASRWRTSSGCPR